MPKLRKRFTQSDRLEIVKHSLESDVRIVDLAEYYGIHPTTIYKWREAYFKEHGIKPSGQGIKKMSEEEEEIARLKKQLREAELERDILKKAISDMTYFRVDRKWYYLTAIIDLADRYVVGWTISEHMSAELTTQAAFKRAVANRPPQKQMLFHSDRGVQYACDDFIDLLEDYQCQQSMSRKANC